MKNGQIVENGLTDQILEDPLTSIYTTSCVIDFIRNILMIRLEVKI